MVAADTRAAAEFRSRSIKRGDRVVRGDAELVEKLGGRALCPCGSGRRFRALLPAGRYDGMPGDYYIRD